MEELMTHQTKLANGLTVRFMVGPKIEMADNPLWPPQTYLLRPKQGGSRLVVLNNMPQTLRAQALVSPQGYTPLALQTADCIPAVAFTTQGNFIALLHLGWRELFTPLLKKFLKLANQYGYLPSDLHWLFGPSICKQCYTHDTILRRAKWQLLKLSRFSSCASRLNNGQRLFDLPQAWLWALKQQGIKENQIEIINTCTYHQLHASFRQAGAKSLKVNTLIVGLKD